MHPDSISGRVPGKEEPVSYSEKTLAQFSTLLSEKVSVPGGGGAAALAGALAAALGSMTGRFTVGKKRYAAVEEEIQACIEACDGLRVQLLEKIDEDAEAFEPLSRAYGLPKDAENREEILEKCLKDAAKAPAEIAALSKEVIDHADVLARKGSTLMVSDAGCSAVLAKASFQAAVLNVYVNTRLMKDREAAEKLNAEMKELEESCLEKADEIYAYVAERLK